jgi:hypothetical protein
MKRARDTQAENTQPQNTIGRIIHQCSLNDLPMDLIRLIALCSDHVTALSIKHICKKFYKDINIPPCLQLISVDYDKRLEGNEFAQERELLLHEISLNDESLNTIAKCYPKLECLLIDYSCKWDDATLRKLYFQRYSGLWRIFINLNVSNLLNMGESSNLLDITGSSTVEHLTFHISRIDPITSKIIPDMHKRDINLLLDNLLNFNSW